MVSVASPVVNDGSSQKVSFRCSKVAFVHCQFQDCFLDAFKHFSEVFPELFGIVCSYGDIFDILSALVSLDKFVQIFTKKLEHADFTLQRPCASLLEANVLYAKLKASIFIDLCKPFDGSGEPESNLICKRVVCRPCVWLHR